MTPEPDNQRMEFVQYLEPDLHDGQVVSVEREETVVRVVAQDYQQGRFEIVFDGVEQVDATDPPGMTLYALAELQADAPLRRFSFVNWDEEEDERRLEIVARSMMAKRLPSTDDV